MAPRTAASDLADLRTLRDKGFLSRLMILRALARGPAASLRPLADELGVTVQAVSEHVKRLTDEGLVASGTEGHALTPAGVESARAQLLALKAYVDGAVRELNRIDATAARAGGAIKAGDPVGLFMEDGELVAYARKESPSRGRARHDARAHEDLWVEHLEGIVALEPGHITIAGVPDAAGGGSRRVDLAEATALIADAGLVVALGPVARRLAERCHATPQRFGGAEAAVDAAIRGVDVLILVEESAALDLEERVQRAAAERGYREKAMLKALGG